MFWLDLWWMDENIFINPIIKRLTTVQLYIAALGKIIFVWYCLALEDLQLSVKREWRIILYEITADNHTHKFSPWVRKSQKGSQIPFIFGYSKFCITNFKMCAAIFERGAWFSKKNLRTLGCCQVMYWWVWC